MKIITIDGKKFEKVKIDFGTISEGDAVYLDGSLQLVEVVGKGNVCLYKKSDGYSIVDGETFSEFYYTLKEIKPPEIITRRWMFNKNLDELKLARVGTLMSGNWQEVKPINGSCTMFEVV